MTVKLDEMTRASAKTMVDQQVLKHHFVISRDQRAKRPFDHTYIINAISKAFIEVYGVEYCQGQSHYQLIQTIAEHVINALYVLHGANDVIHVEVIQDQVVRSLMDVKEYDVAQSYILYRKKRENLRAQDQGEVEGKSLFYKGFDGELQPINLALWQANVAIVCQGLPLVSAREIVKHAHANLYNEVSADEVFLAFIMAARIFIEREPEYSYAAARLLLVEHAQKVAHFFKLGTASFLAAKQEEILNDKMVFKRFINFAVDKGLLNVALQDSFDLDRLAQALKSERNKQFTYLGLQTLYDRYFIHYQGVRLELPQVFFMRVAMGLALAEPQALRTEKALEYYDILSSMDCMSSTPTLFNSGTKRSQLSSCYVSTISDDLSCIFDSIKDNAMLAKFAGGLGNDWTSVRASGANIKGTNGESSGIVPFLFAFYAAMLAVNQGGKRNGALCCYLSTWHLDIEDFLELRKNTGDERRRTPEMNTANWIPDLFMERVIKKESWTLFSPDDVPDLHDLYGQAFRTAYEAYEKKAEAGLIRSKKIDALILWRKMLSMVFETGHPWMTFKDAFNVRSPQKHVGVIHSSNLCTEIGLNTSSEEIAVCNLLSINLVQHAQGTAIDYVKLKKTVSTAIRMLDNVIDINYYAVEKAKNSNLKHRPIGLGIMGFQDVLYIQGLAYESDEAVQLADELMEHISYYAIEASVALAKERGAYPSFPGSLWSQGILPIDSIALLKKERGQEYCEQDTTFTLDWATLRQQVQEHGVRNSNILAIAPTATIANICGVTQSIEPTYQNLFVKSNLSGEFTVVNPYLVQELKALKLWDDAMINDLKYYDGSIQAITRIPQSLKKIYRTAFELDSAWLIKCASRRQKWIDQSQSLNLYLARPSGKKLDEIYRLAWTKGLKSTYYLRTLGATSVEKSTVQQGTLNAVKSSNQVCGLDDEGCEACQ
jgi:ribonucleoside-diphosphate reductase alpha chain